MDDPVTQSSQDAEPDWSTTWSLHAWSTGYVGVYPPDESPGPCLSLRYPADEGGHGAQDIFDREFAEPVAGYRWELTGPWWPDPQDDRVARMAVVRTAVPAKPEGRRR